MIEPRDAAIIQLRQALDRLYRHTKNDLQIHGLNCEAAEALKETEKFASRYWCPTCGHCASAEELTLAHMDYPCPQCRHARMSQYEAQRREGGRRMITPQQLEILRHALGLSAKTPNSYRNYYVSGPNADTFADCQALEATGMMVRRNVGFVSLCDVVFFVTQAGRRAVT